MRRFTYESEAWCLGQSGYLASQVNWFLAIVVLASMKMPLKLPSPDMVRHYTSALQVPLDRRDAIIIPAFLTLYLALDRLSFVHPLGALNLTLWNPPPALSLALLLTLGFRYLPLLFVAAILSDEFFQFAPPGWMAKLLSSTALALGYGGLALLLRTLRQAETETTLLSRTVHLLLVVPAGVLIIAAFYCGALVVTQALPAEQFLIAVRHFWIGDTIGIVTLLPALLAGPTMNFRRIRDPGDTSIRDTAIFTLGICAAFALIFGRKWNHEFEFFYMLFLPIIWIAIRLGYVGAAICIPLVHAALVLIIVTRSYDANDFMAFQMLMLALSTTGLLLGAAITERQQFAERVRAQQSEFQRISRVSAVGGMGAALAHQISQPLSTIATYVFVARRQLASQADLAAVGENLEKAAREAERARQILEGIRDFIALGRLELTPVNLVETIHKITAAARNEARQRGVSIRLETSVVPVICADSTQIEQVLVNLISNGIDAASERKDGAVVIRSYETTGRVTIEVEDNGPGISSEIVDRLFEPFVTTKPRGMGLGVAMSWQIIDAHGGKLRCEPVEPRGCRFVIELGVGAVSHHDR
jgi:two-component system, LuxR family, sensor kinase FixL